MDLKNLEKVSFVLDPRSNDLIDFTDDENNKYNFIGNEELKVDEQTRVG